MKLGENDYLPLVVIIFTKFQEDWTKNVDFLQMANFWKWALFLALRHLGNIQKMKFPIQAQIYITSQHINSKDCIAMKCSETNKSVSSYYLLANQQKPVSLPCLEIVIFLNF